MQKVLGLFFIFLIVGCTSKPTKEVSETIEVSYVSTIEAGGMNAVEISAYCAKTKRLFSASTSHKGVLVYDIADAKNPKKITTIDISKYGGNVNSVAISNGNIAMAIENTNRQEKGIIVVYNTKSLQEIHSYEAGALPDMIAYDSKGNYIVSANEGEPSDDYLTDPKGSVTIVNTKTKEVATLDFSVFDTEMNVFNENEVLVLGKNTTFSSDIEPEYVTISKDGITAWVTMQENNAIAEIDIKSQQIKAVYPLGVKDFSLAKNALDVSDKDGKIQLRTWKHVKGFYQPDAITNVEIDGETFLITANEGDARDYSAFADNARISELKLDSIQFPNAKELQQDAELGRLKVHTKAGDIDNDGDFDTLYIFGTRSYSIWNTKGKLVYDSGNDIAKRTQINPKAFNQNDTRSDDKGSEPEALATLKLKNKTLLFVGLERASGILLYDISNPTQPIFLEWINHKGDISPEGLFVIPASESPTGENILVVSNEISGTISLFEVK